MKEFIFKKRPQMILSLNFSVVHFRKNLLWSHGSQQVVKGVCFYLFYRSMRVVRRQTEDERTILSQAPMTVENLRLNSNSSF